MNPYAEIISNIERALATGWFGCFTEGPNGDSFNVEISGDGEVTCDSDSEEAQTVARKFAANWRTAHNYGRATLDALHACAADGALIENAYDLIFEAAAAERRWGDDPVWGPIEDAITEARDAYWDDADGILMAEE
jgi:hypothetical protein